MNRRLEEIVADMQCEEAAKQEAIAKLTDEDLISETVALSIYYDYQEEE